MVRGAQVTSSGGDPPARAARAVVVALLVLALPVAAFVVSTIPGVRSGPGFSVPLDGWLQGAVNVALAALAVGAAALNRDAFWWLVAAAVATRAAGFVLYLGVVRTQEPIPYPSLADAAWLSSGLLLLVATGLLLRRAARSLTGLVALDGVVGGITVAALAVALVHGTVRGLAQPGLPTDVLAVNLAYPVIDVALLVMVAGVLVAGRWHASASVWLYTGGVVVLSLVDAWFLHVVLTGTYRPGTPLAALSVLATFAIAGSGLADHHRRPTSRAAFAAPSSEALAQRYPGIATTVLFAFSALGILVVEALTRVPSATAMLLAALALGIAMVRGVLTLRHDRGSAEAQLRSKNADLLRFQSLVETSGDFIAIADLEGNVMFLNPAGRRLVGLAPDADVTRTTIADYLTAEGLRASLEVEQPAVVAQGHWEGESTLRDMRGGPAIPVAISSFLMLHPDSGEPIGLATVQRDITERRASERSLRDLAEQRRELLDRLVAAQEEERSRIAADVHDDSVQVLAAVELRLGRLARSLGDHDAELLQQAQKSLETVQLATERLRNLLFDLESPAVEGDLVASLREMAHHVLEPLDVRWSVSGDGDVPLSRAARVAAYRVAKEALGNARTHAGPSRIAITVRRDPDHANARPDPATTASGTPVSSRSP